MTAARAPCSTTIRLRGWVTGALGPAVGRRRPRGSERRHPPPPPRARTSPSRTKAVLRAVKPLCGRAGVAAEVPSRRAPRRRRARRPELRTATPPGSRPVGEGGRIAAVDEHQGAAPPGSANRNGGQPAARRQAADVLAGQRGSSRPVIGARSMKRQSSSRAGREARGLEPRRAPPAGGPASQGAPVPPSR